MSSFCIASDLVAIKNFWYNGGSPIFGYIADLREAYDISWLLLGLIIFLVAVAQYLFYLKVQRKSTSKAKY